MTNIERNKYKTVRGILIRDLKRDLIGPEHIEEDIIYEPPSQAYITGILYPLESEIQVNEVELERVYLADNLDEEYEDTENNDVKEETILPKAKTFKQQNSMGVKFYIEKDTNHFLVKGGWGKYTSSKKFDNEKQKEVTIWTRDIVSFEEQIYINSFENKMDLEISQNVFLIVNKKEIEGTNAILISVFLTNKTVDKNSNNAMFQCQLILEHTESQRIFLCENEARKDTYNFNEFLYRNKPIFAKGFGCAVSWNNNDIKYAAQICSEFIPIHEVESMSTDLPFDRQYGEMPNNYFSIKKFAEEVQRERVFEKLNNLANRYENWINMLPSKDVEDKQSAKQVVNNCSRVLERIRTGIEILESNNEAFLAFKFMNEVMHTQIAMKNYAKNRTSTTLENELAKDSLNWRPFQLAFILLNIEGLVNPASKDRELVDLLWFPTGGGKTEAYLGIAAFLLGYRRLIASTTDSYERDGGVTILLRYTLRLLTTQQRDRLMRMICASEYIRQKQSMFGKSEFSVGFWVGAQVTANRLSDLTEDSKFRSSDRVIYEYNKIRKQIIECPCCGNKELHYKFLPNADTKTIKIGVQIYCRNEECFFKHNHIPVYLIDEEIYRKLPSVVISTVDKFARLPWEEKTASLFGRVNRLCEKCGFISEGEKHPRFHKNPNAMVHQVKPFYPPELIIQDELHLITGPLGTIYGGYETIVEELSTVSIGGKVLKPKYIAATATIKNAANQIEKVFGRKVTQQFPPSGLDVEDSFFAKERNLDEFPFRLYTGICVSGNSMKTVLLRVYAVLLQTTENLLADKELSRYVDPYRTLVGYFNSVRELGGAVRLLDDDIKKRIQTLQKKHSYAKPRYINRKPELTSRVQSSQIPRVLEQLERTVGNEELDVVLATNMISVGMDVDRLGLMVVTGQPKQTSEYIQSSSRVGRSKPGLVVTVYNPYRPRDMSHYQNFKGYHQRLYHFVEGTTATPYASRARDRVLHAIAVALLRLTNIELAKNEDAGNIKDVDVSYLKEVLMNRIRIVEPRNVEESMVDLNQFLDQWIEKSALEKDLQYYFYPNKKQARIESTNRILARFSEDKQYGGKSTLDSMRQVEGTSSLYIYEGWNHDEKGSWRS
ncbi:DISARM system helicase DrmA [Bacillus paramycoides]|uniref:DISARM system helicase DrmA n=1 Tax=Bacillus paramycoides TaxID=2026194 RepID=UPI002E1CD433|nr:DISARM system helicase DrmA [Bacillus paramycoides]